MPKFKVFLTDVFAGLRQLADGSVDCVVTSPPYWGLRDYKVEGQIGLVERDRFGSTFLCKNFKPKEKEDEIK